MLHGETWEVQLAAMGLGHGRALWSFTRQGVCPPLHRGRSSDETSNGEAVAGALGWGMTRVTKLGELWAWKIAKDLESPVQKCTSWKPLWSDTVYIFVHFLASRVYSLSFLSRLHSLLIPIKFLRLAQRSFDAKSYTFLEELSMQEHWRVAIYLSGDFVLLVWTNNLHVVWETFMINSYNCN